ncbi:hypothetical protein MMPV_003938 [Pyropia vietnamensis]
MASTAPNGDPARPSRHPPAHLPQSPLAGGNAAWDTRRKYLTHGVLPERAARHPPPRSGGGDAATGPPPPSAFGLLTPLAAFPPATQDLLAADDLLHALLGVSGRLVVATTPAPPPAPVVFAFSGGAGADAGVAGLVSSLLPLASDYVAVRGWVEACRLPELAGGRVAQALAGALRGLLDEYVDFVGRLEGEVRSGRLPLQRLVFLCRPAARSMALLRRVVTVAGGGGSGRPVVRGGALLRALESLGRSTAGDAAAGEVVAYLANAAAAPAVRALATWLAAGVVDDPHDEFFVAINPAYAADRGAADADGYWQQALGLRPELVPPFVGVSAPQALAAGKYLRVLRECQAGAGGDPSGLTGSAAAAMASSRSRARAIAGGGGGSSSGRRRTGEWGEADAAATRAAVLAAVCGRRVGEAEVTSRVGVVIRSSLAGASAALMRHLLGAGALAARLRAFKTTYLLASGNYLSHFLDAAGGELAKRRTAASAGRLQALLDLSLRVAGGGSDGTGGVGEEPRAVLLEFHLATQLATFSAGGGATAAMAGSAPPATPAATATPATAGGGGDGGSGGGSSGGGGIGGGRVPPPTPGVATPALLASARRGRDPPPPGASPGVDAPDSDGGLLAWDAFAVDVACSWPASLVLTPLVRTKFQMLFRYLLHLKRAARSLDAAWLRGAHLHRRHYPGGLGARTGGHRLPSSSVDDALRPHLARAAALRWRMAHFVTDLLTAAAADVIEPAWAGLEARLAAAASPDDCRAAVNAFTAAAAEGCVLGHPPVVSALFAATRTTVLFAEYVEARALPPYGGGGGPPGVTEMAAEEDDDGDLAVAARLDRDGWAGAVAAFEAAFDANVSRFLDALGGLARRRADPRLAELCERLDWNGWYAAARRQRRAGGSGR